MSKKILSLNDKSEFEYDYHHFSDERPKVVTKRVQGIGINGEVIYETTTRYRGQNGSGFVLAYTEKVSDLIVKVPQGAIIRVFMYIAAHQHHELGGYRVSRKHLAEVLNLDAKSVYTALKYLTDKFIVNETRVDGQLEFMVNPNYVTVGSNKQKRLDLWNKRWEEHWKRRYADKVVH